ncbi:hypothetical protein ERO13_A01G096800v2 [Gossypium hirsutum]|uniref:Auxin-responsive protein SAUR71 n=1 Tax=Gossypium hirsutum TaxID=3635 RepID=A0A1U8KVM9_GOSHI|nr:auxin-responsive protein SAUR71 [Gossypium hirsutum]KAG4214042.1 hypothetical protein ERO13_A01G096800v2 [Gossypium hirsutum]
MCNTFLIPSFPLLYIFPNPPSPPLSSHFSSLFPTTTLKDFFLLIHYPMKQLIRRLSRVADASSQYSLLSSDTDSTRHRITRRAESFRIAVASLKKPVRRSVPEGHVPVYVGEEMERFLVNAELLNHPVFVSLLNKSAQEYGYDQKGVLHIPCHVLVFERVMEALRLGADLRDLQDLLRSFSDDCFLDL